MSWATLPAGVWQQILHHVPLIERLCSCGLVCKLLKEAAAAATQELSLDLYGRADRCQQLLGWLVKNGQHVTSVQLLEGSVPLQLPCPHLQQLNLDSCVVQSADSNSSSNSLTGLTKLTAHSCSYLNSHESMEMLAALSELQHLELCSPHHTVCMPNQRVALPSEVLQQLTRLTHLKLAFTASTDQTLQHVSTLHDLKELVLQDCLLLSPSTTPGISGLTALTSLGLEDFWLDVAVLQPLTRLQQLSLASVWPKAGSSPAAVLAYISQLTLLQRLHFDMHVEVSDTTPAAAYAALTAHSSLKALAFYAPDHPEDLWQCVFPEAHRLMQCTSLQLVFRVNSALLGTADVSRLASCCPGLRQLQLILQQDAHPESLTQLTALTQLVVYAPDYGMELGCLQTLPCLTGLSCLELCGWSDYKLWLQDYLQLTHLQQLTRLSVSSYEGYEWSAAEGKPEVWQQLLQAIADESGSEWGADEGQSA